MNLSFNFGPYLWLTIPVLIGLITYYWIKWNRVLHYWKSRNIATPMAIPILGNNLSLILKRRPQCDIEWQRAYGKVYGLYIGEKPFLTVAEPDIIKQILVKDFHLFRNRRTLVNRHKVISKAILIARDDDWKRIRAIASPTFTSGKLRKMYSLINKCCTDFLEDLDQKVEEQKEFELIYTMGTYTMDVIARCAFAAHTNTYKDAKNEFLIRGLNVLNIPAWKMLFLLSLPAFIFRIQRFRQMIKGTENQDFFINFATNVMKRRKDNNEKHNDFLQLLMDVERSDDQTREESDANEAHHVNEGAEELKANKEAFSDVLEKKLTENEILGQCFIFLIAGFETTAHTLSYCTYELALNPELQERLFEETRKALNENGEIEYDVLSKLPFLDALISETLRHYPPILRLEREANEDVVLGESGIKIERGVVTEIPIYAIHHDPDNYSDPFSFKPDRFMHENRDKIKPYTYVPFGAGPRNCLGMRFALLEAKLALAKISQRFKFQKVATTDVPPNFIRGRGALHAKHLIVGIEKR